MVVVTTSILVTPPQCAEMPLLGRRWVSLLPEELGGSRVQPRQLQTRRNRLFQCLHKLSDIVLGSCNMDRYQQALRRLRLAIAVLHPHAGSPTWSAFGTGTECHT